VTIRWRGARPSTVIRERIEHVYDIEGHAGATRIVWDPQPGPPPVDLICVCALGDPPHPGQPCPRGIPRRP
jgi:hypothetical protein